MYRITFFLMFCILHSTSSASMAIEDAQRLNEQLLHESGLESFGNEVRELIIAGADANYVNDVGDTPLLKAVNGIAPFGDKKGNVYVVDELIAGGANVNYVHPSSHTPLTVAVMNGSENVAALLINLGANVHHQSSCGNALSQCDNALQSTKLFMQLVKRMLTTRDPAQIKKLIFFHWCLKQKGIPRDVRSLLNPYLLTILKQEAQVQILQVFRNTNHGHSWLEFFKEDLVLTENEYLCEFFLEKALNVRFCVTPGCLYAYFIERTMLSDFYNDIFGETQFTCPLCNNISANKKPRAVYSDQSAFAIINRLYVEPVTNGIRFLKERFYRV